MKGRRERGAPSKILDSDIRQRILLALSKGANYKISAEYGGIQYNTFNEWHKIANEMIDLSDEEIEKHEDKIYYDFFQQVRKARALAACKWLEQIDAAATHHWQAAAWKLERIFPREYGRVITVENGDEDALLAKAKMLVDKLKSDADGRPPTTED